MKQKKRIIFLIILSVLSINTQFSKNKNNPQKNTQKNTQKRRCPLKKLGNIAYFFGSIAGATLIGYYIYKYTNEKKFLLEKTNQQKDEKSTLISPESTIVPSTLTPINQEMNKYTTDQELENTFKELLKLLNKEFLKSLNEELKVNPPFNEEKLFPKMQELSIF